MFEHLRKGQIGIQVDVQDRGFLFFVGDQQTIVFVCHQAHGVEFGEGHFLRGQAVVGRDGADFHVVAEVRQVGDAVVVHQLVLMVHMAVVCRDGEIKVVDIQAFAVRVLEYQANFVCIFCQADDFFAGLVFFDGQSVEGMPKAAQFVRVVAVFVTLRAYAEILEGRGAGVHLAAPVAVVAKPCPGDELVGAGIERQVDPVAFQFFPFYLPFLQENA